MMHKLYEQFATEHPGTFFLDADNTDAMEAYLGDHDQLRAGERVQSADPAGEGNMNCTLRVQLGSRSLIVKQARPWVEKYPQIAAPWDRTLSEARFYMLTSPCEQIADRMPKLLDLDAEARLLILKDVGQACDFTGVYRGEQLTPGTTAALATWLSSLHRLHYPPPSRRSLRNREMRQLNRTHIYELPLDADNGLDLDGITPGLGAIADRLIRSSDYVAQVRSLGDIYLADGPSLLHGDFFPGSWLNTPQGATIIDPEFAFFGRPEFDVGVFLGHLYLSNQPDEVFTMLVQSYHPPDNFDWGMAVRFAGCEVMRRLIGVAQLPLAADLARKEKLLTLSMDCVLRPGECLPTQIRATAG